MNAADGESRRMARIMNWLAALAILGFGWIVFDGILDDRQNPNRNLVVTPGATELTLKRNRAGHYLAPGRINGKEVRFLLDTGATQVSVPAHLGPGLGLRPGLHSKVLTANGAVTVSQTVIDELTLGPFVVQKVQSHLNPGMRDDDVLLGMSVLKHLEFTQRGDTLFLRLPSNQ